MANTLNLGNGNWATKEDSLLAYNSENGNFKPLPFDFTRASSATVVNKAGLIETVGSGEPRIDFSNDAKGALLLEPTRSNLITYSNDFSQSTSYQDKNSTILLNQSTSPNGSNNASSLIPSNTNTFHAIAINKPTVIGQNPTFSIFIKPNGYNFVQLVGGLGYNTTSDYWINFDIENKTMVSKGSAFNGNFDIIKLNNGYVRISAEIEATSNNSGGQILLLPLFSNIQSRLPSHIGNGSSVYIYGAQLEQGSYATSYIPTQGSAVTRSADACNNGGNEQVINSTEGVLYAEISALVNENVLRKIQVNDNTSNNNITIDYYTSSNSIRANLWNGSSQYSYIHTLTDVTLSAKVAFLYKSSEFKFYVNGIKVNESSSGSTFSSGTLKTLDLSTSNGSLPFYGNVKDVRVYNTSLTDAELQALTK